MYYLFHKLIVVLLGVTGCDCVFMSVVCPHISPVSKYPTYLLTGGVARDTKINKMINFLN